MRKSISSVLLLLVSFALHAEQSYQAPLVKESLLLDIASGDITVAVGERGHVLIKRADSDFTQVTVDIVVKNKNSHASSRARYVIETVIREEYVIFK